LLLLVAVCLQADEDGDDEGGDEGDEDEEGFVVGDGYLSDDEGMRDDEEPLGEGTCSHTGFSCGLP
jgi:hypothetical protein